MLGEVLTSGCTRIGRARVRPSWPRPEEGRGGTPALQGCLFLPPYDKGFILIAIIKEKLYD